VRSLDERTERLQEFGAEVVVSDFADYSSLMAALESVKAAYFCHPVSTGIAEAAGLFAAAVRAQGLERIVDLSLGNASPDGASPQVRAQWVAEKIFDWAAFDGVHLRIAAFFMENVFLIDERDIREDGRIANAFGDTVVEWIAGADVGAMAAELFANPELVTDRVVTARATQRLTYAEIAAILTDVLGRQIRYEELTPQAWRDTLIAELTADGEPNVRGADQLEDVGKSPGTVTRARPSSMIGGDMRKSSEVPCGVPTDSANATEDQDHERHDRPIRRRLPVRRGPFYCDRSAERSILVPLPKLP
jgi:uncharacterized protein YbjT (DUF2867 family)